MSEANKRTAIAFIEAMSVGDADGQDRCLAPDAVTETKGFAGVSGRRTREMMLATCAAFKDLVPTGFRPRIDTVTAEGNRVIVEFEGNAVVSSGEPYCNQYVFVFTFSDGKIQKLNEYFCTVLADRVMLPLLAKKGDAFAHGDG